MNIQELADFLTSDDQTEAGLLLKAINLFEFQTSWLFPTGTDNKSIATSTRMKVRASYYVILKFYEYRLRQLTAGGRKVTLADLATDKFAFYILSELFLSPRSVDKFRNLPTSRAFDRWITDRWRASRPVADLIDVSYRVDLSRLHGKHTGGLNTAVTYLSEADEIRNRYKPTALKSIWREYKENAIFLFLVRKLKFPLRPRIVSSRRFASQLWRDVSNQLLLKQFFSAYSLVQSELATKGYSYPAITGFNEPVDGMEKFPLPSLATLGLALHPGPLDAN